MTMLLTLMHIAYCGPAPLEFPFLLFADTSSAFLKYVFRNIIKHKIVEVQALMVIYVIKMNSAYLIN